MKNMAKVLIAICVAALAMAPTAVEKSFLKFDNIKGGSTDGGHQGWIEASSFSWGVVPAGFTGPICMAGPGGGPHTLHFVRRGQPSGLGSLFSQHTVIPSLTVEVGGQRHLLQGVTLTSFDSKPAGNGNVTESLSLNYTKCETHDSSANRSGFDKQSIVAPDSKYAKVVPANAILIGLTPQPQAAALIGLLFNGDGHATLTRRAGGPNPFAQALSTRQVIPSLTLTLSNGQKWTFTNVTIGGFTGGVKPGTESLSLNFTKVDGPLSGFQDLAYKE